MLSNTYEAGPRVRSLPMSTSQPPGPSPVPPGPGVMAAPGSTIVMGPQVATAVPVVSAPGSGQGVLGKNGTLPGSEEEVCV